MSQGRNRALNYPALKARANSECEFCAGQGYITHLPLHPDDHMDVDTACECVASEDEDDMTPKE
jgi:hypothetical protein